MVYTVHYNFGGWGVVSCLHTCSLPRFTSMSRFWERKPGDLGDEREKSQEKSSEKKQHYWGITDVWTKHTDTHHISVLLVITKFNIATTKVSLWPGIPRVSESHLLFCLMTIGDPEFPMIPWALHCRGSVGLGKDAIGRGRAECWLLGRQH